MHIATKTEHMINMYLYDNNYHSIMFYLKAYDFFEKYIILIVSSYKINCESLEYLV